MNSFSALDSNYRRGRCLSHIDTEGFTRLISDEYRRAHGFLTSGEIRSRRAWLGMTQQRFSEYLGTGVASVKRWELGQIQDRAMDELMRLKTDLAAARKNLRSLEEQLHEHP
jgi:DNA-binding transcriptional regulator YiaG